MAIVFKLNTDKCILAIWEISESLKNLKEQYNDENIPKFKSLKRKKEYLATRILLNKLAPKTQISYNIYGAPELNISKQISISHSDKYVLIGISNLSIGVDIQKVDVRTKNYLNRFNNESKGITLDKNKATLIWSCKEAIFKWHQKGQINFKTDIKIYPFEIVDNGKIIAEFKEKKVELKFIRIDNYYLVYVCK